MIAIAGLGLVAILYFLRFRDRGPVSASPRKELPVSTHPIPERVRIAISDLTGKAFARAANPPPISVKPPASNDSQLANPGAGRRQRPRALPSPLPPYIESYFDKFRGKPGMGTEDWWIFGLNHHLALIDDIDQCLGGRARGPGKMTVWLVYRMNPPGSNRAEGVDVEPDNSTLSPDEDAIVLQCAKECFVGLPTEFPEPSDGPDFHAHMSITIPVDDDPVYRFLRTGSYH